MTDFDSSKLNNFTYSVGNNISKQTEKKSDDSQNLKPNIIAIDNFESKLLDPPEKEPLQINFGSIKSSCQLTQAKNPPKFYSSQITYDSTPISKRLLNNSSQSYPNLAIPKTIFSLAQFIGTCVSQSHVYIIQILKILKFNIDNKRDDKPNTCKEIIYFFD